MSKRFLITGAAGFIGSHLVEGLLNRGYTVVGMDNEPTRNNNLAFIFSHPNQSNVSLIDGEIQNFSDCQNACKGVDYVLHNAGLGSVARSLEVPELYHDNNVTGTFNMLRAASEAGVKRFVFASSSSVYGKASDQLRETFPPHPLSPYAYTKFLAEIYCAMFSQMTKGSMKITVFRYFNVFGPRQDTASQYPPLIAALKKAIDAGETIKIFGDGNQVRDFTYVGNVVNYNIAACEEDGDRRFELFNIASGESWTVNTLVTRIKQLTGSNCPVEYLPERPGQINYSHANVSAIRRRFPGVTPIDLTSGLEEFFCPKP